jgi:hypothetical protein
MDVPELGVPVGILVAFQRFRVALQAGNWLGCL